MKLTDAKAVLGLTRLAGRTPQSYRRLLLCAPFISEKFFRTKVGPRSFAHVPTVIITHPDTIPLILRESRLWPGPLTVASIPNLHAKVYIACGKDERDSVAIVGSFNLTSAAFDTNLEVGIRLVGNTPEHRRLINSLEALLMRTALAEPSGAKI
jgi:PLD-like domain